MKGKAQLKVKLGHVVQIHVCVVNVTLNLSNIFTRENITVAMVA